MSLYAQTPVGIFKAVSNRSPRILREIGPIHGLQAKVIKCETFVLFRRRTLLRVNQFQLLPTPNNEIRTRLWTDANPIDPDRG